MKQTTALAKARRLVKGLNAHTVREGGTGLKLWQSVRGWRFEYAKFRRRPDGDYDRVEGKRVVRDYPAGYLLIEDDIERCKDTGRLMSPPIWADDQWRVLLSTHDALMVLRFLEARQRRGHGA